MRHQRQKNFFPAAAGAAETTPFPPTIFLNECKLAVAYIFRGRMAIHNPDRQFGSIGDTKSN